MELDKLRYLLDYWIKHNNEHAEIYMIWAKKASQYGNEELSKILIKLCFESRRLNRLFESAKKANSYLRDIKNSKSNKKVDV